MTRPIPNRSPSPGVPWRRCGLLALTVRRCLPFCLAPPAPPAPARRGYGYRTSTPVVCGTAGVPVQACRFLRAAPPPDRYGELGDGMARAALPPARRRYGYVASASVVRGTAGVPVRPCRFLRAALRAGPVRQTGRRYGPAPPARAHCLSENRSRRLSALRSAVKTAERSEALA